MMKKLFFLSLFFVIPLFVTAQNDDQNIFGYFIANELATAVDGLIEYENYATKKGETSIVGMRLSDNVSFDSVRTEVNAFIKKYPTYFIEKAWRRYDEFHNLDISHKARGQGNEFYGYKLSYSEVEEGKYFVITWEI